MRIRSTTPDDRDLLVRALDRLVEHLRPGEPYLAQLRTDADPGAWIDTCLDDPDGQGLVAEEPAGPVVCALGRLQDPALPISGSGRVGFIALVWVDAHARRRGLARRLCEQLEEHFRARGARWVELSYLCHNAEAAATWSALGYAPFRIQARKAL